MEDMNNKKQGDRRIAMRDARARQQGSLEAWKDAIRKIVASYDDKFHKLLQQELTAGVTELGADPIKYELEGAVDE